MPSTRSPGCEVRVVGSRPPAPIARAAHHLADLDRRQVAAHVGHPGRASPGRARGRGCGRGTRRRRARARPSSRSSKSRGLDHAARARGFSSHCRLTSFGHRAVGLRYPTVDCATSQCGRTAGRTIARASRASAPADGERDRKLSRDVVEAMVDAGFFRLCVPASVGGGEADPATSWRSARSSRAAMRRPAGASRCWRPAGMLAAYIAEDAAQEIFGDARIGRPAACSRRGAGRSRRTTPTASPAAGRSRAASTTATG